MCHVCEFICYLCVQLKVNINTRSLFNQALKSAHRSLFSSRSWPWGVFSSWLASRDLGTVRSSYLAGVEPMHRLTSVRGSETENIRVNKPFESFECYSSWNKPSSKMTYIERDRDREKIFSWCSSAVHPRDKSTCSMMTSSNGNFSALLAICAWNSPFTCEFPSQRPVTRSFDVFFDLCLHKQLSKQSPGLWFETPSHHYDVTVMVWCYSLKNISVSPINGHTIPIRRC